MSLVLDRPRPELPGISGEDLEARTALAPKLLDYACLHGADEKRGNYMSVVEGRNWPRYSSCADLAHWLFYRLGCRQPWINRYEHATGDLGEPGWDDQVNVGRLAFTAPNIVRRLAQPGIVVSPGDVFIGWNQADTRDSHVFLARSDSRLPGALRVAEYGQPGGHIVDKVVSGRDGALFVHGAKSSKRIQRWLSLHLVVTNAAELGLLDDVSFPEGFVPDTIPSPPPESAA